jgi:beta-N-acetylhexosaminidase
MKDATPLMIGLEGPRPDRAAVGLLRETGAASVLLLARNIESPAQVRRLVLGLRERLGRDILFAVDHEGGWVLRFRSGLTAFPGNAALGRAGDPRLARRVGEVMGRELGALGVGLNLAPVLDVLGPDYNPGIHIRSFGRDPAEVSRLGAAFIRGLQGSGVGACAKHFPGKGAARQDAHLTLPTVGASAGEMASRHLSPFAAAIRAGVDCVMSTHAVYPSLDSSRTPASFSKKIIEGWLRRRLGFRGVAVSDDLCMGAVTESRQIPEAALDSFLAGHDLLIVAHSPQTMIETAGLLRCASEDGRIPRARWEASLGRVERLSRRRRPGPGPLPPPDRLCALDISRKAFEVVREGRVRLPLPVKGARVAVLWPDLAEVRDRFTFEGGPEAPLAKVKARMASWPCRTRFVRVPVSSERSVGPAVEAGLGADIVLFFCFEAMRFPAQKRTLEEVQKSFPEKLLVCLLRNPFDEGLLADGVTAVQAYGYRDCQVRALLEGLR